MERQYEKAKIDIGLVSQALNNTNVTGKYHSMAEFRSALAVLNGGHMVKTKTAKLEIMEAKNAAAGSAQSLTDCTITANEDVTELTILVATVLNGETIEINGLTFTGHTDTTTVADREFAINGNDAADAAELAVCINDPTYGVPGVTATVATATLTLVSTVPGAVLISAVSSDATFTVVTTKAQAYVDLEGLALTALFTHIAIKVTVTDTATWAAVVLIRYHNRKLIDQKVGASYPA